jgi:uncharacterized membrane protein
VDHVDVSTVVYLPPPDVYAFLLDFPRYAKYSKHLRDVSAAGDGGPGTEYALRFAWWKLTYTVRSEVTAIDPPERIEWRVTRDVDAAGYWQVDPLDGQRLPEAPPDAEAACRVRLRVRFRPDSVDAGAIDLPRFVSMDWLVERVVPIIEREAQRVVERIVADLEGRERPVELTVTTS